MVYRVSPLTYALGKPRVKVTHFAMALIAGEEVVPELVRKTLRRETSSASCARSSPMASRGRKLQGLAAVKAKLRSPARMSKRLEGSGSDPGDVKPPSQTPSFAALNSGG